MKKEYFMKRMILTIFLVFALSSLHAQLGWQIGYINSISKFDYQNLKDISFVYDNATGMETKYVYEMSRRSTHENGIQGGLTWDMKFNGNLSFLHVGFIPTIIHSTFEIALTDHYGDISFYENVNMYRNTIEIPVEIVGVIPVSRDVQVIAFVGPTFSVGGIMLISSSNTDWTTTWDGQKLNLELGGGIGIRYKKATLKGAYDWGVLKYGSDNTLTDGLKISLGFTV